MQYNPKIWGPHYWFFLLTVALCYPINPNTVTKKKYYEFILNFPLFIPDRKMSVDFEKFIDEYPVTPYLDSRESFVKWVHFIHNKMNIKLKLPCISYDDALKQYYSHYIPKNKTIEKYEKYKKYIIQLLITIFLIIFSYSLTKL